MPSADSADFNCREMYYLTLRVRWGRHQGWLWCQGPMFFLLLCSAILQVCFIQRHGSSWSHGGFQWQLGYVLPYSYLTVGKERQRQRDRMPPEAMDELLLGRKKAWMPPKWQTLGWDRIVSAVQVMHGFYHYFSLGFQINFYRKLNMN